MHESQRYRREIDHWAKHFKLDPDLVEAVVRVESSGLAHAYRYEPAFWDTYLADQSFYKGKNPRRVSASYGLMQVMYATAVDHGFPAGSEPELLFVPDQSLYYGCHVLSRLMDWAKGNIDQALAAYNGGKRGNEKPPFRNRGYVAKVKAALEQIEGAKE